MIKLCQCDPKASPLYCQCSTDEVCRIAVAPKLLELCAGAGPMYRVVTDDTLGRARHMLGTLNDMSLLSQTLNKRGEPNARVQRQLRGDWVDITDPSQEWFT